MARGVIEAEASDEMDKESVKLATEESTCIWSSLTTELTADWIVEVIGVEDDIAKIKD